MPHQWGLRNRTAVPAVAAGRIRPGRVFPRAAIPADGVAADRIAAIRPVLADRAAGAVAVRDERLVEIIEEVQPDVLVEDNVVAFPAITASGRP